VKFLIVDDDRACRELLHAILAPYADCHLARDGQEAINTFRLALENGEPYDLICLDIMMPGTDGHRVLDAIRQMERRRGICGSDGTKVVMTTASMRPKDCVRAFEKGCESYCTKPVDEQELLGKIRTLLGALRPQADDDHVSPKGETISVEPIAEASTMLRCLVVDDDGVCRALLQALLAPYADCNFAYDGQEAIDAVRLSLEDDKPYDLITLDIMMPGVNGHDALQAIRAIEEDHAIHGLDGSKIIMTTALRDSKHCIQSFREGCEAYVTKPVNESELYTRLRQLGLLVGPVASTGQ
jgi:two-component system, chemotaxis family, chemotaxis protein CheY